MTRKWWALVAIALGTFITDLDTNIVSLALPSIQRDLGLTLPSLEWIVSAYLLAFAALLLGLTT
jgi:MFS family permease